jgi:hypothetical protein
MEELLWAPRRLEANSPSGAQGGNDVEDCNRFPGSVQGVLLSKVWCFALCVALFGVVFLKVVE